MTHLRYFGIQRQAIVDGANSPSNTRGLLPTRHPLVKVNIKFELKIVFNRGGSIDGRYTAIVSEDAWCTYHGYEDCRGTCCAVELLNVVYCKQINASKLDSEANKRHLFRQHVLYCYQRQADGTSTRNKLL